jgi:hypothetical protein
MTTLADVNVGDKVTIEFEIVDTLGAGIGVCAPGWATHSAFNRNTVVKSVVKAPPKPLFKVGDKVKAVATVGSYYRRKQIVKTGVIQHIHGKQAWVSWEKNKDQGAHESLFALTRLQRA